MKLVSGSLLVTLVSSAAWAAAPQGPAGSAAPAPVSAAQPAPAAAPSRERLALARQFVGLTVTEDSYFNLMRLGALRAATQMTLASEDGADTPPEVIEQGVDMAFAKIRPVLHVHLPRLLDAYAHAYAGKFSADELRAMNAFAASPAGKHYLGEREFVLQDPGVLQAQQELMEATVPVMEDMQKAECAKAAAARVAAGDKKATCPLAKAAETRAG
jgi:hypothetical protein